MDTHKSDYEDARELLERWLTYYDKSGSSAGLKEDTQKFLERGITVDKQDGR
jgi:hypothetical protein